VKAGFLFWPEVQLIASYDLVGKLYGPWLHEQDCRKGDNETDSPALQGSFRKYFREAFCHERIDGTNEAGHR